MRTANDTAPPADLGYRAAVHVLRAAQRDPRGLGYYVGPCAQSFELLCMVVAAHDSEDLELVRARFGEVTEERRATPASPMTRLTLTVPLDKGSVYDAIGDLLEEVVNNDALQHFDPDYDDEDVRTLIRALDGATVEGA